MESHLLQRKSDNLRNYFLHNPFAVIFWKQFKADLSLRFLSLNFPQANCSEKPCFISWCHHPEYRFILCNTVSDFADEVSRIIKRIRFRAVEVLIDEVIRPECKDFILVIFHQLAKPESCCCQFRKRCELNLNHMRLYKARMKVNSELCCFRRTRRLSVSTPLTSSISTSPLACRLRTDRRGPEIWPADKKPVATWSSMGRKRWKLG